MLVGNFKTDSGLTVVEGPMVWVNNFEYLGSWVMSLHRDFEVQQAQLGRHASTCTGSGNLLCPLIYQDTYVSSKPLSRSFCSTEQSVDNDKGNSESAGPHLYPATTACARDHVARSQDQHPSVSEHSTSVREASL